MFSSNHPSLKQTRPFSQDPSLVLSQALHTHRLTAGPALPSACNTVISASSECHTTGQEFISYIKTVSAISDYFPNCYIIWGGGGKMERQTDRTLHQGGACPYNEFGKD